MDRYLSDDRVVFEKKMIQVNTIYDVKLCVKLLTL